MTLKEDFVAQINHQETKNIPYTLPINEYVSKALDEYYQGTEWRNKIRPYTHVVPVVNYFPLLSIIDDQTSRDGYGGIWRRGMSISHQIQPPIQGSSSAGFQLFSPETAITPEKRKECIEACKTHKGSFMIAGLGAGIWEMYWHWRGFGEALIDTVAEPEFFEELAALAETQLLSYIKLIADIPFDAIMLSDDWGIQTGTLLGRERWNRLIKPHTAKVIDGIHAAGKFAINHSCGSIADIMPDIIDIGLDVIESVQPEGTGMNPYELKRKYGKRITFWGGLGSQSIIPFGTPTELKQEIASLCSEMSKGGGYILAPAKSLMEDTPIQNAVAIFEAFTNQASRKIC